MISKNNKSKWFFPIETQDDACQAIRIAYRIVFVFAVMVLIAQIIFYFVDDRISADMFDPVFLTVLGLVLRSRSSRLVALTLFAYSILVGAITLMARLGHPITEYSGRNVFIAAIFIYGCYKGVQGTFGYHRVCESRILPVQILKLSVIIFGYVILWNILFFALFLFPSFVELFAALDDGWQGVLWLTPLLAVILFGCLGWLPGTRKIQVVKLVRESGPKSQGVDTSKQSISGNA